MPQEVQTEEVIMVDKFNSFPEDQYHNYKEEGKKKKRRQEETNGLADPEL